LLTTNESANQFEETELKKMLGERFQKVRTGKKDAFIHRRSFIAQGFCLSRCRAAGDALSVHPVPACRGVIVVPR
jgi:hypothetical protein